MSLISEINRTETEKNKTKTVATNIDNKLVELGGEQATDLSDVPNKMGVMVKENYKKVAIIDVTVDWKAEMVNNRTTPFTITASMVKIDFTPKFYILEFKGRGGANTLSDIFLDTSQGGMHVKLHAGYTYDINSSTVKFDESRKILKMNGTYLASFNPTGSGDKPALTLKRIIAIG